MERHRVGAINNAIRIFISQSFVETSLDREGDATSCCVSPRPGCRTKGGQYKPPPLFSSLTIRNWQPTWFLGGLAGSLRFEGFLAANVHLDLLGLGLSLLGEVDLQHALVIVGAHLSRINGTGQREGPSEASVLSLDTAEVFLLLLIFDLALAVDGERVAFDTDINIFFVDARDFKLESNVVLVFVDVHRRCKVRARQSLLGSFGAEGLPKK